MRGAAALFLVALLGACQPAAQDGNSGSARPSATSPAQGRLTTTLQALVAGYTFEATVSLEGNVATRASGRWLNGTGEFAIEAQGAALIYRTVPPQAWVLENDSGWIELDSGSPLGNPIDAFLKPTTLATVGGQGDAMEIRATYPAAAFGLSGDPVAVDLTLGADGSVTATYRTATPAGEAVSETLMTPAANLEPVTAPSAG
jgi:hypothetical protein